MRHADDRMPLVVVGEQLLALSLPHVIDLFLQTLAELVHERSHVKAGKRSADDAAQQSDVAEVGGDAARDARILDLDGHRAAVVRDGPVDLADRSRREGQCVPLRENALRHIAQLIGDHRRSERRRHRWGPVLQPRHGGTECQRHVLVDVARHLAELHEHTLHRAELFGDLVSRAKGQVVAELAPPLDRGEQESRRPGYITAADAQGKPGEGRAATDARLPERLRRSAQARIRSSMRCRASRTPGSDSKARSRAPSSWRTGSRSIRSSGGAAKPYISRAHAGSVPTATWPRSRHKSRISASRSGGSRTTEMASFAAGVAWRSSTDSRYARREATVVGTWEAGTPTISAKRTISAT